MLASKTADKGVRPLSSDAKTGDSSFELKFISDLGRSLLFSVHPKKVAARVARALQTGARAEVCAFIVELENIGLISCAFDADGEVTECFLQKQLFEKWLELLPPQISYLQENETEFLLKSANHNYEYISPLHINGEVKGAVIVGFAEKVNYTDAKARLIDAATQMGQCRYLSAHMKPQ